MFKLHYISLFIALVLTSACDSSDEANPEVPQIIIDQSLAFFDGNVIESGIVEEEGQETWEVKIENTEGSVVKFYWTVAGQGLLKMAGDQGPFDYDIWPGEGFINFSTAKTVAIGGVKNDTVRSWELAQEDEFNDMWVYSFEIDVQQVYVDAENGNILQID